MPATLLDLYCERVGPGLWAEPMNASSNIAFFLAAWAVWRLVRRVGPQSPDVWLLFALLVTIGVGSSLFHTFATWWARILDAGPILLFQLWYVWLYCRELIKMRRGYAAGLLVGFVVGAYLGRQFPQILNGSLIYAPASLLVVALGVYHARTQARERFLLLGAAGVFLVAFFFRTIDNAVCPSFPTGTHFLWHLLVPVVLYLSVRGLLLSLPRPLPAA